MCPICGSEVPPKLHGGPPRVYCSSSCARRSYRKRHPDYWKDADPEKRRQNRKRYLANHRESIRAYMRQYNKRYREEHRDQLLAYERAYRTKREEKHKEWKVRNRDHVRQQGRQWYASHSDVVRQRTHAYYVAHREEVQRQKRIAHWSLPKEFEPILDLHYQLKKEAREHA